jgi:hypothetical protein
MQTHVVQANRASRFNRPAARRKIFVNDSGN